MALAFFSVNQSGPGAYQAFRPAAGLSRGSSPLLYAHGGLLVGAARAESDPDQDADGHQQPGGEQDVQGEAEDGQGHDGDEDEGDDRGHGDRSPFGSVWLAVQGSAGAVVTARDPGHRGQRRVVGSPA